MRVRSRRATERYALTFTLATALALGWSAIGCRKGRPPRDLAVVSQGSATESLVTGAAGASVLPIGPKSPHVEWRYTYRYGFAGMPRALPDGTLYAGTLDGQLLAFAPDGSAKWTADVGNEVVGAPAVASDGSIYVGTTDGYLVALDPDGNMRWRYFTVGRVSGPPVVAADGVIYFGSDDGCLYAMNPDGTEKWSHRFGDPGEYGGFEVGPVSIGDNGALRVYAGGRWVLPARCQTWEGDQTPSEPLMRLPDGDAVWSQARSHDAPDACFSTVLVRRRPDGTTVWERRIPNSLARPLVSARGVMWSLDGYGGIRAFDADGTEVTPPQPEGPERSVAAAAMTLDSDGALYAVCRDCTIRRHDPEGKPDWTLQVTGPRDNYLEAAHMVLGRDSRIYVTRVDGVAYAVGETPHGDPADDGVPPGSPVVQQGDYSYYRLDIGRILRDLNAERFRDGSYYLPDLGKRGDWAAPAVPALVNMTRWADHWLRKDAVEVLGRLGPVAAEAGPILARAIPGATDDLYRNELIEAAVRTGAPAVDLVPALLPLIEPQADGRTHSREVAIEALGQLGGAAAPAVPKLVEISFGEEPRNSADEARKALVAIGRPSVAPLAQLLDTCDRSTSRDIYITLGKIGEPALDVLARALDSADPKTRQQAAAGLGCTACDGAMAALEKRELVEQDPMALAGIRGALAEVRRKRGDGTRPAGG